MLMRQGICFGVFRPQRVINMEMKLLEKEHPPCLSEIQLLCLFDGEQVLMVRPDHKWFTAALVPVMTLFQGPLDGQQQLHHVVVDCGKNFWRRNCKKMNGLTVSERRMMGGDRKSKHK